MSKYIIEIDAPTGFKGRHKRIKITYNSQDHADYMFSQYQKNNKNPTWAKSYTKPKRHKK